MIDANYSERTWYEGDRRPGASPSHLVRQDRGAGLRRGRRACRADDSAGTGPARHLGGAAGSQTHGLGSLGPQWRLRVERFAWGADEIAGKVGLDAARGLYTLSRHGTEYVRREIAEGDPSIRMGDGWLGCIRYNNAEEKRAEVEGKRRNFDQEKRFLDIGETRALVNTQRYFQSALDPTAFHTCILCAMR